MTLRDSVLIQADAVHPKDLTFLIAYIRRAQMADSLVSNFEDTVETDVTEWIVNKKIRDTQEVELTETIVEKLRSIDDTSIQNFINPFYGVEVRDRERSQILHYGTGGHYIPHVDAETLYKDDTGIEIWEKTLDRDLSIVYFLNDDFEGGELTFPEFELAIQPKAGTLVCFPSDHNFIHGVSPVTSGHRFTIVTWMRVKGMQTVEAINAKTLDDYHHAWPKQFEQPPRVRKWGHS